MSNIVNEVKCDSSECRSGSDGSSATRSRKGVLLDTVGDILVEVVCAETATVMGNEGSVECCFEVVPGRLDTRFRAHISFALPFSLDILQEVATKLKKDVRANTICRVRSDGKLWATHVVVNGVRYALSSCDDIQD